MLHQPNLISEVMFGLGGRRKKKNPKIYSLFQLMSHYTLVSGEATLYVRELFPIENSTFQAFFVQLKTFYGKVKKGQNNAIILASEYFTSKQFILVL